MKKFNYIIFLKSNIYRILIITPFLLLSNYYLYSQLEDYNRLYITDEDDNLFNRFFFNNCSNIPNYKINDLYLKFNNEINNFAMVVYYNTISDKKTGKFIFSTDGFKVINSKFEIMENGDSISMYTKEITGNSGQIKSFIVPFPENDKFYYIFNVFSTGSQHFNHLNSIYYSIIDISKNNGLGSVILKQMELENNNHKFISLVPVAHQNGKDIWLIAKDTIGDLYIYLINKNGIKLNKIQSKYSLTKSYFTYCNQLYTNRYNIYDTWSTIQIAPNGKYILIYHPADLYSDSISYVNSSLKNRFLQFVISDFDKENGLIKNPITISIDKSFNEYFDFFFSPNGKKLYLHNNLQRFAEWDLSKWDSISINNSYKEYKLENENGDNFKSCIYYLRDGNFYFKPLEAFQKENKKVIGKINTLNETINSKIEWIPINWKKEFKQELPILLSNSHIYHSFLYHFIDYKKPICETKKLEFDLLPFVPKGAEEDPKVIFEWKGPKNFFSLLRRPTIDSVTLKNSGWYYLTLFTPEDTLRDSLYIDIPLNPNINISSNKTQPCPGDTVILKIDSSFKSIYWNTGDSTKSIKVTKPGKYSVQIEDDNCCNSYDEFEVVYADPPNPEIEIIGNNPACYGDTVLIMPKYYYPIISWDDGDTNRVRKLTKTTGLELTVIDSNGCSAKSNIEIKFANKPKPTITGETKICLGTVSDYLISTGKTTKKDILISGGNIISQTDNELIILWDKVGDYLIEIMETDTVNSCIGKTSLNIRVDSLKKPKIIQENPLCTGFDSKLSVKELFDTYQWSTGETTQSIKINKGGTYKVVCTLAGGCKDSSEITITESPKPEISIKSKTNNILCQKGDKIELYCEPQVSDFKYLWNTSETTTNIIISDSGTYQLIVSNANGCSDTAAFRIDLAPEIQVKINSSTDRICKGEIAELSAEPVDSKFKYLWNTGNTSQRISVTDSGEYKLKITNEFGCTKEISKRIDLNPTISILIDTTKAKISEITNLVLKLSSNDKILLTNVEISLRLKRELIQLTENQKNITSKIIGNEIEITQKIEKLDFSIMQEYKYSIEGLALLSDSLHNEIKLNTIKLNSNEYCLEKQNGALVLENICTFNLRKIKLIENYYMVSPNPASDYIEIRQPSEGFKPSEGSRIEIFNIFGEKVEKISSFAQTDQTGMSNLLKIDISNLQAGVYFIRISDKFEKFVKL